MNKWMKSLNERDGLSTILMNSGPLRLNEEFTFQLAEK